jgi:hypothetical protein
VTATRFFTHAVLTTRGHKASGGSSKVLLGHIIPYNHSTQNYSCNKTVISFFLFSIFYAVRYFIQVIFENLVKALFLKSFCERLGGVSTREIDIRN